MSESAPLFGRKYNLRVFTNDNKVIDLSELHAVFNTTAWVGGLPKTLRLRIFNATSHTMLPIQDTGGTVYLSAGYEGQNGDIFIGQIIQIRTGREDAVNIYYDITATDGDEFQTQGFISHALDSAQTSVQNRMFNLVQNASTPTPMKLGEVRIDPATPTDVTLPRGRSYFGMAKDHIHKLAKSVGATYEVQNNNLVHIIGVNQYKQLDIPDINYKTGLIGVPEQTNDGISFKMLLNPYIVQNMQIKLDSNAIKTKEIRVLPGGATGVELANIQQKTEDGIYLVGYCNHIGDTRGNTWFTEVICYTPKVAGPVAQLGAGTRVEQI